VANPRADRGEATCLRLAHLFPDRLNLYGDRGNVATLVRRAGWRGIAVDVRPVLRADDEIPPDTRILFIGGGADRDQAAITDDLVAIMPRVTERVADGAVLLAVCGGYQNLGREYRSAHAGTLTGAGFFDAWTEAPQSGDRLVGGCVVSLGEDSPIAAVGRESAARAGFAGQEQTVVGFENHGGRTFLGAGRRPLGSVVAGFGNNARDGAEGIMAMPGEAGRPGFQLGTYLHGPLLPRNPHLADYILLCALAGSGITQLTPLDDRDEWAAHASFAQRWQQPRQRR
jgi:CobQ-like glutamine amidotransferase family enzyme